MNTNDNIVQLKSEKEGEYKYLFKNQNCEITFSKEMPPELYNKMKDTQVKVSGPLWISEIKGGDDNLLISDLKEKIENTLENNPDDLMITSLVTSFFHPEDAAGYINTLLENDLYDRTLQNNQYYEGNGNIMSPICCPDKITTDEYGATRIQTSSSAFPEIDEKTYDNGQKAFCFRTYSYEDIFTVSMDKDKLIHDMDALCDSKEGFGEIICSEYNSLPVVVLVDSSNQKEGTDSIDKEALYEDIYQTTLGEKIVICDLDNESLLKSISNEGLNNQSLDIKPNIRTQTQENTIQQSKTLDNTYNIH